MTTVQEIIAKIEEFAPTHLAEDWDLIGLSIGSRQQKVDKMLVALDLDANTLKEAKEKEVDFIFTHHPAIFSPLKTLNEEDSRRNEYIQLIRSDISLYSAHTNVDAAENGMNDWLTDAIGLEKPYQLLDFSYKHAFKLLTVHTSRYEFTQLLERLAVSDDGGLRIHNSSLYNIEEKIDVRVLDAVSLNEKFELILPDYLVGKAIAVLFELSGENPPNYFLTEIEKQGKSYGIGRVGSFEKSVSINELIERVKDAYSIPTVRTANIDLNQKVQRIAILGGSGEKYYKQALAQGADLYITGDISYHSAQDMIREGLPFIDPGHFIENIFVKKMTEKLNTWKEIEKWPIEIIPSTAQKDVFKFK